MDDMSTFSKIFIALLLIGTVIGISALAYFSTNSFQGLKPAILPSSSNIVELLETPPGENNTTFPLSVADGFAINVFAQDLKGPRVLAIDPSGRIVVSIPSSGQVVALEDSDGDGVSENKVVVASNLNRPHGLLFYCSEQSCQLYVAELNQVSVFDYNSVTAQATNKRKHLDLPGGGRHNTRTLLRATIDNQEKMLISVGSTCDVCYENNPIHGSVQVADFAGNQMLEYANGLRNAVFLATHPVTGQIWVTEMGRDMLGDELPPDEINILQPGGEFGWPECYGNNVYDARFSENQSLNCEGKIPSHIDLPAHSAPLGLAFVPEEGWPEDYWHDLLVAYHGSWNRSEPTGYKIERIELDSQGQPTGERSDFIAGWLANDGTALGRPVDVLTFPGGTMYISDDKAGVIYRVVRQSQE